MNLMKYLSVVDQSEHITIRCFNTGKALYKGKVIALSDYTLWDADVISVYTQEGSIVLEVAI